MKITIYKLIGLIKDGKAPTKIKYKNNIFYFDKHCYIYENKMDTGIAMWDFSCLNDEVELIEEPKKIGKIEMCTSGIMGFDGVENITSELKNKINELIDEINNLKKEYK